MTSEDHNSDALIAALRSPALPVEQVGEAAAVLAMLEVLSTTPARIVGLRTRRGIAIAAVTIASLGVGGLVAAGPGFFQAAADKVFTNDEETTETTETTEAPEEDEDELSESSSPSEELSSDPSDTEVAKLGDEVECAEGNHGKTVSSIAQATESSDDKGEIVKAAAQSDCGKRADDEETPADDVESAVVCAEGDHGQTVTSVVEGTESGPGKGQIVSEAAQSDCGKNVDVDDEADNGNGNGQPEEPGKPNVTTPADTRPTPTPPTDPGKPTDPGQPAVPDNANGGGNPNG